MSKVAGILCDTIADHLGHSQKNLFTKTTYEHGLIKGNIVSIPCNSFEEL